MTLNIADDWRVFDNLQAVLYYSRSAESTFAAPVSCQALSVTLTKQMVQDGRVVVVNTGTAWHVWDTSGLGGTKPKHGDRLKDVNGLTWLVDRITSYDSLTGRWELAAEQAR